MNKHQRDTNNSDVLQQRIVGILESESRALAPGVEQALNRARRKALDTPARSAWWRGWSPMVSATLGATAAAAIVVAVALNVVRAPDPSGPGLPPAMPMAEDLDLVMQSEFDLMLEDPEFVAWLNDASAPHDAPADEEGQSG